MSALKTKNISYIALYGSLMSCFTNQEALGLKDKLKLLGQCELSGSLYDLGSYPGFINNHGNQAVVHAELYEFFDQQVLETLDEFEDYWPGDESRSLYLRRVVRLIRPDITAWVYLYNKPVIESAYISCGRWQQYLEDKKQINA